jgi:hypothetical protein
MFRCFILAIFGLVVPLTAQTTAEATGSGHSPSAGQNRDRPRCSTTATDDLMMSLAPHPYVYVALSLMPTGYVIGAIRAEGGLKVESCHWVIQAGAAYDNGRAANDNGPPNPKGHDRYLDGGIYFRPGKWFSGASFFGVGWRWSQHSTTNYTKAGNRPQFGGGYDLMRRPCSTCTRDFSMRVEGNWFTAGNDWQDGSHGMEISISLPSPRETSHWFFQERVAVFTSHQTVTDRTNMQMTLSQRAHRSLTCDASLGIVYRF